MRLLDNVGAGQMVDVVRIDDDIRRRLVVLVHEDSIEGLDDCLDALFRLRVVVALREVAAVHCQMLAKDLLEGAVVAEQVHAEAVDERLVCLVEDGLAEGLAHALCHRVVKSVDALAAEHVVLVRLDGDAGERCVGANGIRLAQEAVARREATVEELQEIDLAAVERDQREVLVVDVDVILAVRLCVRLVEHVVVDEVLRALSAELEHDAHRGIRIDIRIVALEVGVDRVREEDVAVRFHQMLLCRAALRMLLAVGDVLLRDVVEVVLHELLLDDVLDLLDADVVAVLDVPFDLARHLVDILLRHRVAAVGICPGNGVVDLFAIIWHGVARTFRYSLQIHVILAPRAFGSSCAAPLRLPYM